MVPRPFENLVRSRDGGPYRCPCCGFVTLSERGGDEICPVCFWEDDGQDDHGADNVRGGPNYSLSLSEARRNQHRRRLGAGPSVRSAAATSRATSLTCRRHGTEVT